MRRASLRIIAAVAGTAKTFLHTSGISVTADHAEGAGGGIVRDEDTAYQPIPERAARYAIDPAVRGAAASGCRPIVICCPLVYGSPPWPGRESVQLPHLVADARKHGAARYIGAGEARWSHCHVDDIAAAYALALAKGKAGALYYPETGEQSWGELAARSAACSACRRARSLEEGIAAWGPRALVDLLLQARTRGVRIRDELGWTPAFDAIEPNCRLAVKSLNATNRYGATPR